MGNNWSPIGRFKSLFTPQTELNKKVKEEEKLLKSNIRPQITGESREREGMIKAFLSKILSTFKGFSLAKLLSRLKNKISSGAVKAAKAESKGSAGPVGGSEIRRGGAKFQPNLEEADCVFSKGMARIWTLFKNNGASEGIFRISASEQIKKEKLANIKDAKVGENPAKMNKILEEIKDVHLIAGIMKEILRNSKPSLINKEVFDLLVASQQSPALKEADVSVKLKEALDKLPAENRQLLVKVVQELHKLADSEYGKVTKMGYSNLASVWGLNFGEFCQSPETVYLVKVYNKSITALIQYADQLEP